MILDIQIWPDVPELTLTSGADLTLKCTGNVPVKWTLTNYYDPSLLTDKVSIFLYINIRYVTYLPKIIYISHVIKNLNIFFKFK